MPKRTWLIFFMILLAGGLWLSPVHSVSAAQEDTTAEVEEGGSRGPGAVIIMVGLASIGLVGFAYSARQSRSTNS